MQEKEAEVRKAIAQQSAVEKNRLRQASAGQPEALVGPRLPQDATSLAEELNAIEGAHKYAHSLQVSGQRGVEEMALLACMLVLAWPLAWPCTGRFKTLFCPQIMHACLGMSLLATMSLHGCALAGVGRNNKASGEAPAGM